MERDGGIIIQESLLHPSLKGMKKIIKECAVWLVTAVLTAKSIRQDFSAFLLAVERGQPRYSLVAQVTAQNVRKVDLQCIFLHKYHLLIIVS